MNDWNIFFTEVMPVDPDTRERFRQYMIWRTGFQDVEGYSLRYLMDAWEDFESENGIGRLGWIRFMPGDILDIVWELFDCAAHGTTEDHLEDYLRGIRESNQDLFDQVTTELAKEVRRRERAGTPSDSEEEVGDCGESGDGWCPDWRP